MEEKNKAIILNSYRTMGYNEVEIGLVFNLNDNLLIKDTLKGIKTEGLKGDGQDLIVDPELKGVTLIKLAGNSEEYIRNRNYLTQEEKGKVSGEIVTQLMKTHRIISDVNLTAKEDGSYEIERETDKDVFSLDAIMNNINGLATDVTGGSFEPNEKTEESLRAYEEKAQEDIQRYLETGDIDHPEDYKVLTLYYVQDNRLEDFSYFYGVEVDEDEISDLVTVQVLYNLDTGEYRHQGFKRVDNNKAYEGYNNRPGVYIDGTMDDIQVNIKLLDDLHVSLYERDTLTDVLEILAENGYGYEELESGDSEVIYTLGDDEEGLLDELIGGYVDNEGNYIEGKEIKEEDDFGFDEDTMDMENYLEVKDQLTHDMNAERLFELDTEEVMEHIKKNKNNIEAVIDTVEDVFETIDDFIDKYKLDNQ